MNELACQFGEHRRLAGRLTEPPAPEPRTACVLVNAGLVPKLGPFRLYVELARRHAQDGVVTLRFDLGGIGDSQPGLPGLPLRERGVLGGRALLDAVHERRSGRSRSSIGRGVRRFVPVGSRLRARPGEAGPGGGRSRAG